MLARRKLVQNATQGPHVALAVVWFILAELWREVVWCSHHRLRILCWRLQDLCDAKIPKLDLAVPREENVLRFQVAMENALAVAEGDGTGVGGVTV